MLNGQKQEGVRLDCISQCRPVRYMSHGVLFSPHALLTFYSCLSHLVSFSLMTARNFTLNIKSAACNRLHAFPCLVRVRCLITVCNVPVLSTCCLVCWPQFYFDLFASLRNSASGVEKNVCIQFHGGYSSVSSTRAC